MRHIHALVSALALAACQSPVTATVDAGDLADGPLPDSAMLETPPARVRLGRRLRLLTRAEYDNTITDLTGLPSTWGASFPPEVIVAGFDNNAAAAMVGGLLGDKLRAAAEEIAAALVKKDLAGLLRCPGAMDEACARRFIADWGRRAFRRPLSSAEQDEYLRDVHAPIAAEDGFAAGIQWVITAMLQSPHFLYRPELGPEAAPPDELVPLTDHEIASELSYLLWASSPDEELLAAAGAGQLRSADAIAAQVRRLFASPRSRAALDRFVTQWLKLDAALVAPKDANLYPDFTPAVRAAMVLESRELFARVMRGARLPDLFATPYSYLPLELARFYGLPALPIEVLPGGIGRWNVSAVHRGGILVGSPLAGQARAASGSPIHRGKLVREQLLCQPLPPAPAGLNLDLPAVPPGSSQRDQLAAHSANPKCSICHEQMDPIGLGLERYDGVGRYHEQQGGELVDDSGEIRRSPHSDGKFHGAQELQLLLAGSPDVSECFARQWVRFAWGIREGVDGADTAALVDQATAAFVAGKLALEPLLLAIARSPELRWRRR